MKFHALYFNWLSGEEIIILFGFGFGRVEYLPEARWLYSFRLFLGAWKVELLWKTGILTND